MENWDKISDRNDPSPVESKEFSEGFNPVKFRLHHSTTVELELKQFKKVSKALMIALAIRPGIY